MKYRDLLHVREYRLLFSGQVLSQLGDAIYETGIVWLVYQMTNSTAAVGWLVFCQTVPYLVFGVLAGAYADRLDRRLTMIFSDLIRGLAVLYLAVRDWFGGLTVLEVCAVAVVLTTARTFFHPSMRALLPVLLPREQMLLANSLSEGAKRICKVVGMMLGGVLMTAKLGDLVLWSNAISFFLSLWSVWLIRRTQTQEEQTVQRPVQLAKPRQALWPDIRAAAIEIFKQPAVLFAILLSVLGLIVSAGMIKIGLPLLAGAVLHQQGDVYGLLLASFSVGMFLSAVLMKKMSRWPVVALVLLGWTLYGLTFLGLAKTHLLILAVGIVFITGFAHFLTDIPVTTLLQQRMPLERMSACQSIWATGSFGAESLSVALTGGLLGFCALPVGFLLTGAALLVLGLAPVLPLVKFLKKGQTALDRRTMI